MQANIHIPPCPFLLSSAMSSTHSIARTSSSCGILLIAYLIYLLQTSTLADCRSSVMLSSTFVNLFSRGQIMLTQLRRQEHQWILIQIQVTQHHFPRNLSAQITLRITQASYTPAITTLWTYTTVRSG